jgi:tetratricopeptide (TPR) repeat protein
VLAHSLFLFLTLLAVQAEPVTLRLITVPTEAKAAELRARVVAGESFEALAMENSTDSSAKAGGLVGTFAPADLRREFQNALSGLMPGQVSPVFRIDNEYYLLQQVSPAESEWSKENAAAIDSLQKKRYADAARSFSKAIQIAEKFGVDDDRLGQSLNGLAEAYRLQENFAGAATIYRRILAIRWGASSNKGDAAVADLVDRFADVVSLAYFQGPRFREARTKYQSELNKTPVSEALYLAMTAILVKAELTTEAADVMQLAQRSFPASRRLRYKQAEMYRDSGKMQKALETFQEASQMKAPAGMTPELDRSQLSFIYQRMGGINTDIVAFDAAIAAYKKSLELSPENADARIALGDAYLRRGQHAEATAEYTRVLTARSDKALPYYRLADARLQMGDFSGAAEAAARAVKIEPQLRKARYVYAMALIRMGRDEGQKEVEQYRKDEADAQSQLNDQRDIIVSNRGAAALALNGQGENAIATFRKSIEAHPAVSSLRLNLGIAFEMIGRPRDAATTLQSLLESGLSDDFLIYRSLARAFTSLQDEKGSQKYTALYVRRVDAALEEELP